MHANSNEVLLILIISTSLIILLGAVVVTILLIQNKRKYQHRQQLSDMQTHYQKTILRTKVSIMEETYSTISKNLHDNIGSNISTAMLLLYRDDKMNLDEQETNRKEALGILDKVVDDLKHIARSLNPEYLFKIGISEAIEQRVAQLAKTKKYDLEFIKDEMSPLLDKKKQVTLFYIFQEAINNINSHADAKKILVKLVQLGDELHFQIKDDGKGMEQRGDFPRGAGLVNMKNYADMIGARLEFSSSPGKGTDIRIILSLNTKGKPNIGDDITPYAY